MRSLFRHSEFQKRSIEAHENKVRSYTQRILRSTRKFAYTKPESALSIAADTKYQESIRKAVAPLMGVRHVILVGIGGSSLGTEAVYRALAFSTSPKLFVLDQIDRDALEKLKKYIAGIERATDIALCVVSKSGTTTETMANAVRALDLCEERYGEIFRKQVVFIGSKGTSFLKIGKKKKVICLILPDVISGRFSLFSAVCIAPLMLLGIDTISLREGALAALTKKERAHIEKNAVMLALHAEHGTHTVNFFTFNKRLELCGYWYRQLLAESIGKTMTTKGTTFAHQLLPVVSTSVDLHSMAELYLGGYRNMYTIFVYFNDHDPFHLPTNHWLLMHVPFLRHTDIGEVQEAIQKGVLKAYDDQALPYRINELKKCTAFEVGYLLSSLMCEVMCLAHLFNVDAFNQPSVEFYKKHTRKALEM